MANRVNARNHFVFIYFDLLIHLHVYICQKITKGQWSCCTKTLQQLQLIPYTFTDRALLKGAGRGDNVQLMGGGYRVMNRL